MDNSCIKFHKYSAQLLKGRVPDYIDPRKLNDELTTPGIATSCYGEPTRQLYPCHTKAATFASALYLWGAKANQEDTNTISDELTATRIKNAAQWHGIADDIAEIEKSASVIQDSTKELKDSDFGLVVKYGSATIRKFPLINEASIKASAARFYTDRIQYPYAWRKQAATNILNTMVQSGMAPDAVNRPVVEYIVKAAGVLPAPASEAAMRLSNRARLHPKESSALITKSAGVLLKGNAVDKDTLTKLCEIVDTIERTKMAGAYGDGLPLPEESFFTVPTAEVTDELKFADGTCVKHADVLKLGLPPFTVLGSDVVKSITDESNPTAINLKKLASTFQKFEKESAVTLQRAYDAMSVLHKPQSKAVSTL